MKLKYVSSISACHPNDVWVESPKIKHYDLQQLSRLNGYGISKHVSEVLLSQIENLDFQIYRPGTIIGHSKTFYTNQTDFWNLFLLACVELGVCPEKASTWLR